MSALQYANHEAALRSRGSANGTLQGMRSFVTHYLVVDRDDEGGRGCDLTRRKVRRGYVSKVTRKGTYAQPRGETDSTRMRRVTLRFEECRQDLGDLPLSFRLPYYRRFGHQKAMSASAGAKPARLDSTADFQSVRSVWPPESCHAGGTRPHRRQLRRDE